MNLHISSESIGNPPLIDLLRHLSRTFTKIDSEFFVIGATARDIILQAIGDTAARRKTRDLDIAIAVTDWDRYDKIKQVLINEGFEKSKQQAQRFYWNGYEVDVVPYGGVAKADDNIYWPPEEDIAMSVKGFEEVLREAITVTVDREFKIQITSLPGLFLLKLNAWIDRNLITNKDAEDIWYIIDNYYLATENRNTHQEVYDLDGFDFTIGGAFWIAHDIADLLNKEQIVFYNNVLKKELSLAENSRLVTQILDTNRLLKSEDIVKALSVITDVFTARTSPLN